MADEKERILFCAKEKGKNEGDREAVRMPDRARLRGLAGNPSIDGRGRALGFVQKIAFVCPLPLLCNRPRMILVKMRINIKLP